MRFANASSMMTATALTLAMGCGGNSDDAAESTSGPKKFQIFPPELFSGFDGTNVYKVPISVFKNNGTVTWKVDDMSLVSIETKADGAQVMLTTLKAGKTMLHATAGGMTVDAPLTITMYTPAQNQAGKLRYMTGPDVDNPACQECHGNNKGPDHTPTEVDADPDENITNTFLTGTDPEGRPVDAEHEFTTLLKGKTHKWKVTKEEEIGLVAYLRSLTPTGYPPYDAPTAGEEE